MNLRLIVPVAALLLVSSAFAQSASDSSNEPPGAVQSTASEQAQALPQARHCFGFLLAAAHWGNARNLSPAPTDFVTEQSGRFKTEGYGFDFSYHHRLRSIGHAGLIIGGEFTGYSNANDRSAVGFDAVTGEPARIKLMANWGHLTGTVRLVWREGRRPEIRTGAGIGVYLLRIKESVEGFGVADRQESDASAGGFLSVGVRFPYKSSRFGFLLDGKIHTVSFDGMGGAFAGQEANGPIYTLGIGADWWSQ